MSRGRNVAVLIALAAAAFALSGGSSSSAGGGGGGGQGGGGGLGAGGGGAGGGGSPDPELPEPGVATQPSQYFSAERATDWFGDHAAPLADKVPVMRAAATTLANVGQVMLAVLSGSADTQEVAMSLGPQFDSAFEVLLSTAGTGQSAAEGIAVAFRDVALVVNQASRRMSDETRAWCQAQGGIVADPTWSVNATAIMDAVSKSGSDSGAWTTEQRAIIEQALAASPTWRA